MALLDRSDMVTLDYAGFGQPFCDTAGNTTPDMPTMDYAYLGQPYVRNPVQSAAPTTSIKEYIGVAQASIKKASSIAEASIKKILGVSNVS